MSRFVRMIAFVLSLVMLISIVGCKQNNTEKSGTETALPSESSTQDTRQNPETAVPGNEVSIETENLETEETILDADVENDSETVQTESEMTAGTESGNIEEFSLSDVQPIIQDGHYRYNPYLLSEEAIHYYDVDFLEFYKNFVTAYMNYQTECVCPNVEYAKAISVVISYECPFYSGDDLELSWATNYDENMQRLSWSYLVDEETLRERIQLVADTMQDFLNQVSPDDDEADKMQTLYHSFCPLMTYAHDRANSREKIDGCYALLEHTGICVTFSYAFAHILSQVDIDATIASGGTTDGEAHVWNYVCINDQFYFFDTTFELNYHEGNAYLYYGMNLEERLDSGVLKDAMWLGRYGYYPFVIAENHLNVHE